jgi:hypothetical protein
LLDKKGIYAELWQRQREAAEALQTLEKTGETLTEPVLLANKV